MKYIAIIDTDNFKDFKLFEDADGKYLAVKDANAKSTEWLPLHFEVLDNSYIEDTIPMSDIDGIKAEIKTEISDYEGCADFNEGIRFGLRTALVIIDKHIAGKENI